MKIEELYDIKDPHVIVLMGIAYDNKEELLKDMNEWAKEVGFFTNENTNFTDFDVVETGLERTDIVITVKNGFVNHLKRIEYRPMGWVWLVDYINNYIEEHDDYTEEEEDDE